MHADRSQRGRDLAEKALAALLDETRDAAVGLVVVGGLVPPTLVGTGAAHQGTNDVDIVLELAPVFDRDEDDFIWLEQALVQAGFVPAASEPSWRWVLDVDGAVVELEFLVNVSDVRSQAIALPGTTRVAALSVPGPAAALLDHREQVIVGGSDGSVRRPRGIRHCEGVRSRRAAKATRSV